MFTARYGMSTIQDRETDHAEQRAALIIPNPEGKIKKIENVCWWCNKQTDVVKNSRRFVFK